MKSLFDSYQQELKLMLNRADLTEAQLAIFSEILPETYNRAQKDKLPYILAFLERIAHACNHEVELRFLPRLQYGGTLLGLLSFAQSNLWTAIQQSDGSTRFMDVEDRVMAIIIEQSQDVVKIYLTPHGHRSMMACNSPTEDNSLVNCNY